MSEEDESNSTSRELQPKPSSKLPLMGGSIIVLAIALWAVPQFQKLSQSNATNSDVQAGLTSTEKTPADNAVAGNNDASYYTERGCALAEQEQHGQAIENLSKALQRNEPDQYRIRLTRGLCYLGVQNPLQAWEDFNNAVKLKEDSDLAHVYRGIASMLLKQYPQAYADYKQALALNPENALAYYASGLAHLQTEDNFEAARDDLDQAIKIAPQLSFLYKARGQSYGALENFEMAIKDYDKAIELNPADKEAFEGRTLAYKGIKSKYDASKMAGLASLTPAETSTQTSTLTDTQAVSDVSEASNDKTDSGFIGISYTGNKVTGVRPGSPASAADIRVGDIVLAVDGKAVDPTGIEMIAGKPNTVVNLTLERDNETIKVSCIRKAVSSFMPPQDALNYRTSSVKP